MVSVIIPSYNTVRWLPSCLESCLEQKFLKEIIIVDNGSTDGTIDVVQEYIQRFPNTIIFIHNPTKGANHSRNMGFGRATGKYIQWLDADDRLLPGKFESQIQALENHGADIAYSDWQMDYYDETTGEFSHSEPKANRPYPDFLFEILLNTHWSSPNTYLLTKAMAEKLANLQAWNSNRRVEQDREYFSIAAIEGASFVYTPGTFAVYNRWSTESISKVNFEKRLEQSSQLALDLMNRIFKAKLQHPEKYLQILKTELLVSKYYHPKIKIPVPIHLSDIYWPMIHWKMRAPLGLSVWIRNFWSKKMDEES
ncbi:MAG: glycosyltransferase family 2 protein [Cytophagales bacterium]|nr:glycosyltransferase family 2 protein [Cytophagales bacterium]